jgi:hypothetical protein
MFFTLLSNLLWLSFMGRPGVKAAKAYCTQVQAQLGWVTQCFKPKQRLLTLSSHKRFANGIWKI